MNNPPTTTAHLSEQQLDELEALALAATPGQWMRLFGERTVYDRMEDGCRGNAIVRADQAWSQKDGANLDFIAASNPATVLQLIALARRSTSNAGGLDERSEQQANVLPPMPGTEGQHDAASAVLSAVRDGIALQEPVNISKAVLAQREARVSLSGGTGPVACAMLVNIQLTPWADGAEKAEAFVSGYNTAMKWYRAALLDLAECRANLAAPAPVAAEVLGYAIFRGGIQVYTERTKRQAESWIDAQIVPLVASASATPATSKEEG